MKLENLVVKKSTIKVRKKSKTLYVLGFSIILLVVIALFADRLAPNLPNETMPKISLSPPSREYPFGTDTYGRCVLSRVLVGFKTSLLPAIILVALSSLIGTSLGLFAGYYGGFLDVVLMRITDIFMAFPSLLLAIFIAGAMGGGIKNASLALLCLGWTNYARIVRSFVMVNKEKLYVIASKISGESDLRIIFFHILPNMMDVLIVTMSLQIATMMVSLAGLSFLGLGSALPQAEWGSMISENVRYIQTAPWTVLFPSLFLVFCSAFFNFLGDKYKKEFSK
ncbi:ABC transporter permease [uncultured Anaerococcus sp.]|uniref:ABC transporter permease n=1 Tax=uncultured Anaerococcus sp. TaxID=293428 RepID=UPI002889B2E8|nr:ABC transporter permease [uncultured Anaerococcus sp.]